MKSKLIKYFLRQHMAAKTNAPRMVRADLVMSVAIVAVFEENEQFAWIDKYVKEWRKRGMKSVDFYLFFSSKKALDNYSPSKKDFPFLAKEISWQGKPIGPMSQNVMVSQYDILIDLSRGRSVYCDAIVAHSNATWKTGEYHLDRKYLLDFMIDTKADSDIRNVIHHLDNYLTQFNISKTA